MLSRATPHREFTCCTQSGSKTWIDECGASEGGDEFREDPLSRQNCSNPTIAGVVGISGPASQDLDASERQVACIMPSRAAPAHATSNTNKLTMEKEFQTPMAQGRSTEIISSIRWIRISSLSIKRSLKQVRLSAAGRVSEPALERAAPNSRKARVLD